MCYRSSYFITYFSADVDGLSAFHMDWNRAVVNLRSGLRLFVFMAVRGGTEDGQDLGDICIDQVRVDTGVCSKSKH